MIASRPQIFVDEDEFDFTECEVARGGNFKLDSDTSVSQLKSHFFDTLADIGVIRKFQKADAVEGGELACALDSPNALVACFHEPPPELPCRLIQHTKGGLMLPGGFLNGWTFRESTVSIVTSRLQMDRLKDAFHDLPLSTSFFYPRLNKEFAQNCTTSHRGRLESSEKNCDLVYAGRWIANKGIAQVVRALNLWTAGPLTFRLIGGFELDFAMSQAGTGHNAFVNYFDREIIGRNKVLKIFSEAALPPSALVERFRESKAFIYSSFHEDENFGLAPREAAQCGAIPIVSDICGLGEFGRKSSGALLKTWPTLGGIRYSLRDLSSEVTRVISLSSDERKIAVEYNCSILEAESCQAASKSQLNDTLKNLLDRPVGPPPEGGWRCPIRLEVLKNHGPDSFREALSYKSDADPEGLYVDGTGLSNDEYSEARILTAIQGLYTTWSQPPLIKPGVKLHGFWRVALWGTERALVEFGYPGPRLLRFSEKEWESVRSAAKPLGLGEIEFEVRDYISAEILQRSVDLGYLVPHDPEGCHST